MHHILLVDDEENVLEILKKTISWQEFGVETVLTAHDGQQALETLAIQPIDLLITDIKMPVLDGIRLIEQVKLLYPHIRCILLSAYGEFEYAKQAIHLGVENYLLKPVAKEELEQTIQKSLANLYLSGINDKHLFRENILHRWVCGSISGEELSEKALVLGLNLYLPEYCIVCIAKKSKDIISSFQTACVSMLAENLEVYPFWDEKGRYILIIGGQQLNTDSLAVQLSKLAESYNLEETICISFGIPCDGESLQLSYKIACDAIELSDISQAGLILKNDYDNPGSDVDWLVEEVRFLFWNNDKKTRLNGYNHLAHKLHRGIKHGETDKALTHLLIICMKVLVSEFPLRNDLQKKVYEQKWNIRNNMSQEMFASEATKILNTVQTIFSECYEAYSPIIQLAIKYAVNGVLEGSGGSVKEFCALTDMNSAYLGHIFKKETGIFFKDYLSQCRINRSIILLKNPNNKIKDIAEKVGFMSVSYYVKCFRETKGVSPTRYRMSVKE